MNERNEVMSYSRIMKYFRCPFAYKCKYIDGIKKPSNMKLVYGSVCHKMIEAANVHYMMTDKDLFDDYGITEFEDLLTDMWKKCLRDADLPENPEGFDAVYESSRQLLELYLRDNGRIMPTEAEYHIVTEKPIYITGDREYYLQGYIDGLIEGDTPVVIEYKTSGNSWTDYRADLELQSNFYGLLLGAEELDVRYEVLVKTKIPKIQHFKIKRDRKSINKMMSLIKDYVKGTSEGLFYPARNYTCGPSCDYYEECVAQW